MHHLGKALFILVLASFPIQAATLAKTNDEQVREKAALALIKYPWQQLKYEIVFLGPRHGYRAMTISSKHRIEVYVRPGDGPQMIAYDIAHELGHAIDLTFNTDNSRKKWMRSRGINPATPWFGCNRCSDYNTPAGDFAETFALFLLGPGHFDGRIAPPPTATQIAALGSFFTKGVSRTQSSD
jgi:hypothetical protein